MRIVLHLFLLALMAGGARFTHQQADGNRLLAGQGSFPNITTADLPLETAPAWVVGGLVEDEVVWEVASTDPPPRLPPLTAGPEASPLTHPVVFGGGVLYIATNGDVVWWVDDAEADRLPLNALPDARIIVTGERSAALYVDATAARYVHGVLGDDLEAAALVVLESDGQRLVQTARVDLPGMAVFEGLSPLWADLDGDGVADLVTTVSDGQVGAAIHVYRADGTLLAQGPAIGRGGRWRHQLAYGPFGPDGENELAAVLTPHIGGVVEFYRLNGDRLEIVATLPGYTSHVIGTRNLDMAVAGDFNGDGVPELVLPDQSRQTINGLQRTADGIAVVWSLPLDGTLNSNLAGVTLADGQLALAAGTADNRLRVWLP